MDCDNSRCCGLATDGIVVIVSCKLDFGVRTPSNISIALEAGLEENDYLEGFGPFNGD